MIKNKTHYVYDPAEVDGWQECDFAIEMRPLPGVENPEKFNS